MLSFPKKEGASRTPEPEENFFYGKKRLERDHAPTPALKGGEGQ